MSKRCKDHRGNEFSSIRQMCEYHGVTEMQYHLRIRNGWSKREALSPNHKRKRKIKKVVDHLGNEYPSYHKMYEAYGTDDTTVEYRMNKLGMTLEEALTTPFIDNTGGIHTVTDHLGNEFSSKEAMATHYGIPRATFFRRLRIGWTLEQALTTPLRHTYKPEKKLTDPNGKQFSSIEEMCAEWGIPKKDYVMNIKMGMSVKDALTHKPDVNWRRGATPCKDHLGNEFPSFNALYEHYGLKKDTVRGRIDLGWTLQEILESPSKKSPSKPCKDHLGNEYPRQKDMLAKYGVHQTMFRWRQKRGWTLEECLLGQGLHRNTVTDCFDNVYPSDQILCILYNLETATYYARQDKGYDKEKLLLQFSLQKYDSFGKNLTIKKRLKKYYYEVSLDGQVCIMHAKDIIQNYREEFIWPALGYRIINFKEDGDASIMVDDKYKTISYDEVARDLQNLKKNLKKTKSRKKQ